MSEAMLCDLVRAAESDDEQARAAYAELYARNYDLAMAYAYKLFGKRDRAEDAVSEAYAKTLQALRRDLGPSESFSAYLLAAVKTELHPKSAMDRVTESVDSDDFEKLMPDAVPDTIEGIAERDQLVRAFAELSESKQRVLYLIDVEDQEPAVVAERLGLKLRAMNSQLFRAREDLRTAYLQQYADRAESECLGVVSMLGRFVRGALGGRNAAEVATHLDACVACSEQSERLQRINEGLRAWIGPVGLGVGGAVGVTAFGGDASAEAVEITARKLKPGQFSKSELPLKWVAVVGAGVAVIVFALILWPQPEQDPVLDPSKTGGSSQIQDPEAPGSLDETDAEDQAPGGGRPAKGDKTQYWLEINEPPAP